MTIIGRAMQRERNPGRRPRPNERSALLRVRDHVADGVRKIVLFPASEMARAQRLVTTDTPLVIVEHVV
ncbi:hypothetical protein [Roseomonas rosulenta]|uniref:hypothetical protein n=1 Tax=Roseomonas rosulenta TaxID=2748667 RepID=UPI0018DF4252|nr:hypothetical protein [Roseomonas rosulenta]